KFQSNASTMGAVIRDYPNGEFNMCGIVGAVGKRDITPILLEGLKRLEYRGYDSCGVAVHADGELKRARSTQRVAELVEQVAKEELAGFTGIAHKRWATQRAPATHTHQHPISSKYCPPRISLLQHIHYAYPTVL